MHKYRTNTCNDLKLIDKDKIMDIWPSEKMNRIDKLNAISRLIIILTIIGIILTKSIKIIISGVTTFRSRDDSDPVNNGACVHSVFILYS